MSESNLSEIIITSFITALKQYVLPTLLPYIIPIIATAIVGLFINVIIKQLVYPYSILTGYSHREAKKRVKKTQNIFKLISSIWNQIRK